MATTLHLLIAPRWVGMHAQDGTGVCSFFDWPTHLMIDPDFSSALFCICIAVINRAVFQISFHYHAPFFIFHSAHATVFLRINAIKELSDKRAHQKGLKIHCKTMQIRVFSELEWGVIKWNAKWKCARVKCNCTQTWAGNEEWSTAKHTEAQLCLLN